MIVLLCPGQGTQRPEMLAPWYGPATAAWPAFASLLDEVPGLTEVISGLAVEAPSPSSFQDAAAPTEAPITDAELAAPALASLPEELLVDTASLQPLLVYTGLASLLAADMIRPTESGTAGFLEPTRSGLATAGHSLGYLTALAVAGALSPAQALWLARVRGTAMAAAGRERPGGMVALLGGDAPQLRASLEAAELVTANINGPAQLVAAGPLEALKAYEPPTGVRALRLPVSGAFHSPMMASAEEAIRPLLAELASMARVEDRRLTMPLIDDSTGIWHPAGTPAAPLIEAVAPKITQAVDWLALQRTIGTQASGDASSLSTQQPTLAQADTGTEALGVEQIGEAATHWLLLEAAPAGTLTTLAKRSMRWKHTLALRSAKDLDSLPSPT